MIPAWLVKAGLYALGLALVMGAVIGGYTWWRNNIASTAHTAGIAEQKATQDAADLVQAGINAKETQRRLDRQKVNQDEQDKQLAAARADAVRNGGAADQLRDQNADIARRWRDALADPAAGSNCPAAGDAIGVLADVLGRADKRAGVLASYADTAHISGLKCEADYDALTLGMQPSAH
jgi:hypothetical protein